MAQSWAFGTITTKDQSGGATTIVINKPASTANGDLLVACVDGDAQTQSGPAGWTQCTNSPQTSGVRASYWYKIAASEGASWTWTIATGNYYVGIVARYTNITATPADVSNGGTTIGGTTVTAPTVTTTVTDDLVCRIAASDNSTSVTGFASGTSRANFGSAGDLMTLYDQNRATAAATGTDVCTFVGSSNLTAFTATFKQSAAAGLPPGKSVLVRQAVKRAAHY